jgi:hypothetical protein
MALGAAYFTVMAAMFNEASKVPGGPFPWPAVISSSLLFFGGYLWLVLDSWHHGRECWKLLLQSHGVGFAGVAQLLGITGLVSVAIGVWAWVITTTVFVFKTDFVGNEDDYSDHQEASCADYSDDRPQRTRHEHGEKDQEIAGLSTQETTS